MEKKGGIVLKFYFEKAYDSMDHKFLDLCLEGMGFGERWRGWMHNVIASPMISTLINGSPSKEFGVGRGLRQGDPLSPFLLNIVVEALNRMPLKAMDQNLFKVKVGKGNSNVDRWAELFRCKTASILIKYLGLPLGGRPSSVSFWEPMLDKIHARLALWKMRFLLKAGRLVLIKLVLSSLPMYFMSVFKIPISVALAMEKLQRDFFWGVKDEKKGIHWVDWPTLCKSKRNGGLGIGRIQDKGDALLAKWVWRFGIEEGKLWRR
ncbi:hypothetical protein Dsin_016520, partial [Dipteronia sinensis]